MASYPGAKVHRPSRRKLGRGQSIPRPGVDVEVDGSGTTVTLTFSVPVIVRGDIGLEVTGGPTFVSQVVTSPTVVTQTWSGAVDGLDYDLPAGDLNVSTAQGGVETGASGTFPGS